MRVWHTLVGLIAGALILDASPVTAQIAMPTAGLLERVLMVASSVGKGTRAEEGTIFSFDIDIANIGLLQSISLQAQPGRHTALLLKNQ
jgi:hypothetical protein